MPPELRLPSQAWTPPRFEQRFIVFLIEDTPQNTQGAYEDPTNENQPRRRLLVEKLNKQNKHGYMIPLLWGQSSYLLITSFLQTEF